MFFLLFSFCFSFVFILILYFVYNVDSNNNNALPLSQTAMFDTRSSAVTVNE